MKNLLLVFLLPLLVTILGNNSKFQYGDCTKSENKVTKIDESKIFKIEREVNFIPSEFVCTKPKWYIRFIGVFLIFFPFIPAFLPFKAYYERKVDELSILLRNLGGDVIDQIMRKNAIESLEQEFAIVFISYIVLINLVIVVLGLIFEFPPCQYTVLIYERCLNFFAWLI